MIGLEGDAFVHLAVYALVAAVALIAVDLAAARLRGRRRGPLGWHWSWSLRLLYIVLALSIVSLATTSLIAMARQGRMEGWWLVGHMLASGVFVVLLPVWAVWGAAHYGCGSVEARAETFASTRGDDVPASMTPPGTADAAAPGRAAFWVMLAAGWVAAAAIFLGMTPWPGDDALEQLVSIHRVSGLLVCVALMVHLYRAWTSRCARQRAIRTAGG